MTQASTTAQEQTPAVRRRFDLRERCKTVCSRIRQRFPRAANRSRQGTVRSVTSPEGGRFLAMIVPSDEGEWQAQAMENWFQACASDEPFALELVGTRREQGFLLRASSQAQLTMLCKQFEAQYPQAEIHRVDPRADPLCLHPGELAAVGMGALIKDAWVPFKTFPGKALTEAGADPLANLCAGMETVGSGQRLIAQLVLVRAPEHWMGKHVRKSVEHALQPERDQFASSLKGTQVPDDVAEGTRLLTWLGLGVGSILAFHWYTDHAWTPLLLLISGVVLALLAWGWWKLRQPAPQMYDMKLVAEKMARVGFYSQLRIIAIGQEQSSTRKALRERLLTMEVAYRQFTLASANGLYLKRTRYLRAHDADAMRLPRARHAFPYAPWYLRLLHAGAYSKQVLCSLELAGMFHLPQETTDLPLVRRSSFKGLLASPEIARQIEQTPAPLPPALIGYSQHRRYRVPVYFPFEVLMSHKFAAGMSRVGKSVWIQLLAWAAMQRVRSTHRATTPQPGVFIIDPHRDLIMDLLKLVPPSRAQDVLLLDMTDTQFPVALNPLDASMGFTRDQIVSNLIACCEKIWEKTWGPRMSYFLTNVCLLLATLNERLVQAGRAHEQYTLLDINPLLQYKDYATQVLAQLDLSQTWDQELMSWWQHTYFTLPATSSFRQEIIMPILSKMGVFQDNVQLRRIVGQPVTNAPLHQAITEGKIVLCALSARDMDDAAVNILGSTLINLLHRAFRLQQHLPLTKRRKVFCAVDEFQNFSGADFEKLLSEDAKYGCAMLLATQNLKRLNRIRDGLLEMVLSNCQNLCVFRISAADAELMESELQEKVSVKHIISLPPLHCYARLALPGHPLQIVSLTLAQPASWKDDPARARLVEEIIRANQRRATPVADVDRRHDEHLRRFLDVNSYAETLQRDDRAARQAKEQQKDAGQRAQHVKQQQGAAGQRAQNRQPPRTPAPSTPPAPVVLAQRHEEHIAPSQVQEAPSPDEAHEKSTRNNRHRRSRRMGKQEREIDASTPASGSPEHESSSGTDAGGRPLGSGGKGSGRQAREERERGERA